jgi:hypothetical protein
MTDRRRAIEIDVRVMNLVHAPEQRDGMHQTMQRVLKNIKSEDSHDEREPRRQHDEIQETPSVVLCDDREC